MRIQPKDTGQAKAAARRLRDLSATGAPGTRPLALSRAMEAVARMLGFRDWHELQATRGPASPPDHEVAAPERRDRRRQQASVLEAEGFSPAAAAATVEAILPSGDFDQEMERAVAYLEGAILASGTSVDELDAEAEWILQNLGLPRSDLPAAKAAAEARLTLDGGLLAARSRRVEQVRQETAGRSGWFAVVSEENLYFQGFHLEDPADQVAAQIEALARQGLASDRRGAEGFLQDLAGAFAGGGFAAPSTYVGALQASAVLAALSGREGAAKAAAFGWMLSRETGLRHFVIFLRGREAGGYRTELARLEASNVAEGRAALERLPEVRRIKRALLARLGLPMDSEDGEPG